MTKIEEQKQNEIRTAKALLDDIDNIHIVGAGGIGSHFCWLLDNMIKNGRLDRQYSPISNNVVTVYDFDTVGESNLAHQDFYRSEKFTPKSMLMGTRYGFKYRVDKYSVEELKAVKDSKTLVCICADNTKIRKDIYDYVNKINTPEGLGFIDMRAYQDIAVLFTHFTGKAKLNASLGATPNDPVGASCQAEGNAEHKITKLGNFYAPLLGLQTLLRWSNGQATPTKFTGELL